MPDLTLVVHDVEPPEGHALGQVVAAEAPGRGAALVRHQGNLDFAHASLGSRNNISLWYWENLSVGWY